MTFFDWTQKIKIARSLLTKTSPAYVQYYITARCDQECEQCNIIYAQADSPEMNIKQIRAMAENLADIGVCIVLLIGGEPFLRKDLPEIIKAFVDVGIHVRMQTNGLASKKMLTQCVLAGGHDISISLDSLDSDRQDIINRRLRSWDRTIRAVSTISEIFPENGMGFFGTVLMPRNMEDIVDIIEFATAIGWWVSLVPCHTSAPVHPKGFRTLDLTNVCSFNQSCRSRLRAILNEVKWLRDNGQNVYDSDEYLDDVLRFVAGESLHWRRRNGGVCDSPSLYFAIEPNGNLQPCCDYKMEKYYPSYDSRFPKWFRSGEIHEKVYQITSNCAGCMYGSYPEISMTARYMKPLLKRIGFFGGRATTRLKKVTETELKELAGDILARRGIRSPVNVHG